MYPGVDLVYYGNERQLEYDFVVEPGAEPRAITLAFEGVGSVAVNAAGDLVLPVRRGRAPAAEARRSTRTSMASGARGRAVRARGQSQVGFQVAAYDATKPLVIDPVLVYSSYLGGLGEDNGSGIFVDATGIYVGGLTVSSDFPIAGTPYQDSIAGDYDAYVAKLDPTGRRP